MQMKKMKNSDDAMTSVVVAVLLIGLFVIMLSTIQTIYVPQWMSQKEAEHMNEVAGQFADIKYAIDIQSIIEQDTPISTPITLGSEELPFFRSMRAYGSITILSDECNITIKNNTDSFSYLLGTLKYSSINAYFVDQSYIYEAGGVILSQYQGEIMNVNPSFSVSNNIEVNISFNIINISGVGGNSPISGYGTYPVQTKFSNSDTILINDVKNITVNTGYPNAWHMFFNSTLIKSGLTYAVNFTIDSSDDGVTVEFNKDTTLVNLTSKIIEILTQISSGWIE